MEDKRSVYELFRTGLLQNTVLQYAIFLGVLLLSFALIFVFGRIVLKRIARRNEQVRRHRLASIYSPESSDICFRLRTLPRFTSAPGF